MVRALSSFAAAAAGPPAVDVATFALTAFEPAALEAAVLARADRDRFDIALGTRGAAAFDLARFDAAAFAVAVLDALFDREVVVVAAGDAAALRAAFVVRLGRVFAMVSSGSWAQAH